MLLGFNNNTEIIFEQDSFVVKEEALGYLKLMYHTNLRVIMLVTMLTEQEQM